MDFSDLSNLEELSDDEIARYSSHCAGEWQNSYQTAIEIAKKSRAFTYKDGGQWDVGVKAERVNRGLMAVEYNMIRQYIRNMVAEYKQNNPSATVIPTSDKIPSMPVEKLTGLMHHIDYESNSKYVNGCAYHDQLVSAWGGIEIVSMRESPTNFNQVLRKVAVQDVLECGWDVNAKSQCKIDGDWAFRDFSMSKAQLRRDHPDLDFNNLQSVSNTDASISANSSSQILLRRFYAKNYYTVTVYKLDTGEEIKESDYEKKIEQIALDNINNKQKYENEVAELEKKGLPRDYIPEFEPEEIPEIVSKFKDSDWDVWLFICTANTCIQRIKLPIKYIPLVFVPGEMAVMDGREQPQPYAIDAFTPQKALNYYISDILDSVNRAYGTRAIANDQSIEQYLDDWLRPKAINVLRYQTGTNGQRVDAPTITSSPSCDPNLLSLVQQSIEAIQTILGRNTADVNNQPKASSGKEYLYRMLSMNTVGGIYPDNLNMAIAEVDKVILEWIPYVYDTERTIKIRNKAGQIEYMTINQTTGDHNEGNFTKENDMSNIKDYSVEVYGGPSFAAQKLAGMEFMIDIMDINPQKYAPLILDKVVEQAPFGFSQEIVQRLIKGGAIDPEVLPPNEQPKQKGPSAEQKVMEMEMKLKVMKQYADFMIAEADTKQKLIDSKIKLVESMEKLKSEKAKANAEQDKAAMETMDTLVKAEAENVTALAAISQASSVADNAVIETAGSLVSQVIEQQNGMLRSDINQV